MIENDFKLSLASISLAPESRRVIVQMLIKTYARMPYRGVMSSVSSGRVQWAAEALGRVLESQRFNCGASPERVSLPSSLH